MVVSGEAVNEASNEIGYGVQRERKRNGKIALSLLDGTYEARDGVSGVSAGSEEILGSPVGLLSFKIFLDARAMEEPVLGDSLGKCLRLFEDGSPLLNFSNVTTHARAALYGVREIPNDLTEVLNGLDQVQVLDVNESFLTLFQEDVSVGHASAKLIKVIVSCEAEDEAGNEVRGGVERREPDVTGLNRANSERHECSKVLTRLEEKLVVPIVLHIADVSLDLSPVEKIVLGEGLGERYGVKEDLGPLPDS